MNCSVEAGNWYEEGFPRLPYQSNPPGDKEMLMLVAYDITRPRRLARVARICADYGTRVQYSMFECHLESGMFDRFWSLLGAEIDVEEDRLVAYRLDARCARETLTAGKMVCSEKAVVYLI